MTYYKIQFFWRIVGITMITAMVVPFQLLLAGVAVAQPGNGVGSIDTECQAAGFDFGIAKWEWKNDLGQYVVDGQANGTSVTGTAEQADWTANPAVAGVIRKAAQDSTVFSGGTAGSILKDQHNISHLTFCGNEIIEEQPNQPSGSDLICQEFGFDFAVSNWHWVDPTGYEPETPANGTSVVGTQALASWTSDQSVDGVVRRAGVNKKLFPGGLSGDVAQGDLPIDHIVLCANERPCGDGVLDQGEQCDDGNVVDDDGCSAICEFEGPLVCEDVTESGEGWYGEYFNYSATHPDMELPKTQWPDDGHGDPLGDQVAWDTDWYDNQYFRFSRVDNSLTFGEDFFPFDIAVEELHQDGNGGDREFHFGAHWRGLVTVPAAGQYEYTLASDDDVWIYVDGVLINALPGIHVPTSTTTSALLTGTNIVDIYFAERHTKRSHFSFDWVLDDVIVTPYPVDCPDIEQCRPEELIVNGGFEEPVVTHNAQWDAYSWLSVPGWIADWFGGTTTYQQVSRPLFANIELQSGVNGWLPNTGSQYAELDSDWDGPNGSLNGEPASTTVYQDIPTVPGETYTISFAYSPRPGESAGNNILEFSWDGVLQDTLSAAGSSNTAWDARSYNLLATQAITRVEFTDSGTPDSLGTFLDSVSVLGCRGEDEIETNNGNPPVFDCPDINADGDIDQLDIDIMAAAWNTPDCTPYDCDLDNDNDIDIVDVQLVAGRYGESASAYPNCSLPSPTCGDGAVNQTSEQCDDGNLNDQDGCSAICTIELVNACVPGALWQIGDNEPSQMDNRVDEFNFIQLGDLSPVFADPFLVGTSTASEFPWNSSVQGGYATDFDVDFNYDASEPALVRLTLSWSPGRGGSEQKEVLLDGSLVGATPVRVGATTPGWWEDAPFFADTVDFIITPGAHTLTLKHTQGNGSFWDYVSLEVLACNPQPEGQISGMKFRDLNENKTKDQGEVGLSNWQIIAARLGTLLDSISLASNDADGVVFNGLSNGQTYVLKATGTYQFSPGQHPERVADAEYSSLDAWATIRQNPFNASSTDTFDVYINGADIDWGSFSATHTYYYPFTSDGSPLSAVVSDWFETGNVFTSNNVGAITLDLYQTNEVATTTDALGNYAFNGLLAGNYLIREVMQPGWFNTTPWYQFANVADNAPVAIDFGNTVEDALTCNIFGFKFEDINGNGVWDNGEPGLGGWNIQVDNGSQIFETATSNNQNDAGYFCFTALPEGNWTVTEVLQNGWQQSVPQSGAYQVTVNYNQPQVVPLHFGNYRPDQISGSKYNDVDLDGQLGGSDVTLANWELYLYSFQTNATTTTTTDQNGLFSFWNLAPGMYRVSEEQRSGWTQVIPNTFGYIYNMISGQATTSAIFLNQEIQPLIVQVDDQPGDGDDDDGGTVTTSGTGTGGSGGGNDNPGPRGVPLFTPNVGGDDGSGDQPNGDVLGVEFEDPSNNQTPPQQSAPKQTPAPKRLLASNQLPQVAGAEFGDEGVVTEAIGEVAGAQYQEPRLLAQNTTPVVPVSQAATPQDCSVWIWLLLILNLLLDVFAWYRYKTAVGGWQKWLWVIGLVAAAAVLLWYPACWIWLWLLGVLVVLVVTLAMVKTE